MGPKPVKPDNEIQSYARYASLGLQFSLTFLICGGLGYALDHWLGSYPILMIGGIFLGAAGGFWHLIRAVDENAKREKTVEKKEDKQS